MAESAGFLVIPPGIRFYPVLKKLFPKFRVAKELTVKLNSRNITTLLSFILCLLLIHQPAQAANVGGIIDKDELWSLARSPIIVNGNILIKENVTLTIDPGVIIRFSTPPIQPVGYYIRVDGTLNAQGTEENPILFTAENPEYPWGCIAFTDLSQDWDEAASTGSVLKQCIIEYAGTKQEASVISVSASPLIADNIIRYGAAGGIRTVRGFQNIIGNLIHNTTTGIHLACEGGLIENNYLTDNQQAIYLDSSIKEIEIRNNTLINASAESAGGCLNISLHYNSDPDADAAAADAAAAAEAAKATAERAAEISEAADAARAEALFSGDNEAYLQAVAVAEAAAKQAADAADAAQSAAETSATLNETVKAIIEAMTAKISIKKNHIINQSGNAVAITENSEQANYTLSFNQNTIENSEGNLSVLLYNWKHKEPEPLNMEENWWGTTRRDKIDSKIYDAKNDFNLPLVDYEPIAEEAIPDAGSDISYQPPDDDDDDTDEGQYFVIDSNTLWTTEGSPYTISANILVKKGVTLEIEPGVIVRFKAPEDSSLGYYIRVDGTLKAEGTQKDPVLFTAEDVANSWGCIAFTDKSADWDETASTGSVLKHCVIEYAGNPQNEETDEEKKDFGGAAIRCFSSSPLIQGNTIRYSSGEGIWISGGKGQRVLSNLIHDNIGGITITSENALVENNYLINNQRGIGSGEITGEIEIRKNTLISGDSWETDISCLSLNLYHHETPSVIRVTGNRIIARDGSGVSVSARTPDANDRIRFSGNTVETSGNGLSVYLRDWQVKNPDPLNMALNWWGTTDVAEIERLIYDAKEEPSLPRADYQPIAVKPVSFAGSDISYLPPDETVTEHSGVIRRDTRWTVEESPHIISGNILIRENAKLEIEPGVTVRFKTPPVGSLGYYIRVNGVLKAAGTDDRPILFTAEDTANPWGCIAFGDTSSDWNEADSAGCILKYCIFEYAGNKQEGGDAAYGGAAIRCSSASPLIANNTIRYSTGGGIWVSGGIQRIQSNLIHETSYGIAMSSDGALLENNYIINTGQGIYLGPNTDTTEIKNNTIINTLSTAEGACLSINLFHHEPPTVITVSGNQIVNNTGKAIAISAETPDANDILRFSANNIENTGEDLSVYLHNWQRADSDPVSMGLNWWGTADADVIGQKIYDADDDFYLPRVNFQPFAIKEIADAGSDIEYSPPVEGDDDDDDDVVVEPEDDPRGITEDTLWTLSESPYVITGNILVNENITLEIEPGVVVKFSTPPVESVGYYIRIDGTLKAQGDADNPILFTAEDPLSHRWGCIAFTDTSTDWDEDSSTGSVLRNCVIEYAGNSQEGGDEAFGGMAVRCDFASPLIAENLIRYSAGSGIQAVGGNQRILSNRIHNTGVGIILSPESALVENNYLISNTQGIYMNSGSSRIEIKKNSFLNIDSGKTEEGTDGASEETSVVRSSNLTDGACMSINLYRHEAVSEMLIYENHILSSAGNAIAISAQDPDPNVVLMMNRNNIENTGGNLLLYLHDWQVKNPTPFYMTQNWWGTEDVDEIDGMIYDVKNDFHLPKAMVQPILTAQISEAWSGLSYPPLADAGSDQGVVGDVTVTLDGSDSFDPDNILSYEWTQTEGASVSLSDAETVNPTFISPAVSGDDAILTFQLTVEDLLGFRNSDEVRVIIDESSSVKMERDKGQCFIGTSGGASGSVGFAFFSLTVLFLFLYRK